MTLKKVTPEDIENIKQEKEQILKIDYERKTLSFEKDILPELEAYSRNYAGGNFSGYFVFLHEQFKEWIESEKTQEMKTFFDKFHSHPQIKKMAEHHTMGDIETLLIMAVQKLKKKSVKQES
jgi:hypothetical protein